MRALAASCFWRGRAHKATHVLRPRNASAPTLAAGWFSPTAWWWMAPPISTACMICAVALCAPLLKKFRPAMLSCHRPTQTGKNVG